MPLQKILPSGANAGAYAVWMPCRALSSQKNLSGAQKHIAQDCKDDHDPSFAQNFGTENFGPESFGVKFFDAKSSNDPQSRALR